MALSVQPYQDKQTRKRPHRHRGITSLPPLSAVTLLDSSKNWKSHILALNLYVTPSPLWCMHVTSGVCASLEDLLGQVIYSVTFPYSFRWFGKLIWLTNQNDLCLTSASSGHNLFSNLIICNWSNILHSRMLRFLFRDQLNTTSQIRLLLWSLCVNFKLNVWTYFAIFS